ncbi:MAG: preprotein translocase subunit SecG [Bacteroidales bacterium]|nr:preprotein translocase subunit SecG [Candidatus Liminaster caballi]
MNTLFVSIIVFLAVCLIGIVLIQKSKGGGLAAGFQSSNQIMGAPKTADLLEKTTWWMMGIIAVLCIVCTVFFDHKGTEGKGSAIQYKEVPAAMATPENAADVADAVEEVPSAQE